MSSAHLLRLLRISDDDRRAVREFGHALGGEIEAVIDDFYEWTNSDPVMSAWFRDSAHLERVRRAQVRHWRLFFDSPADRDHLARCRAIGATHAGIGLPIQTYLAAVNAMHDLLTTEARLSALPSHRHPEVLRAMTRLIAFESTVVSESYSDHAHRRIESAKKAKHQFLANVSHELRTPLASILGFTEILLDSSSRGSEIEDSIDIIRKSGEHLLVLVEDILDFSKFEAGELQVDQLECDPSEIVTEVVSMLHARAKPKGLSIHTEYRRPLPPTVTTDPRRLKQILINIVGNAVKFTDAGWVKIVVDLVETRSGRFLEFEVSDSGIGVAEEELESLFQPFRQCDMSSTRRHGGTGLGLALSKELARRLGGDVVLSSSTPGVGSTFRATIEIPSLARKFSFQRQHHDRTRDRESEASS